MENNLSFDNGKLINDYNKKLRTNYLIQRQKVFNSSILGYFLNF